MLSYLSKYNRDFNINSLTHYKYNVIRIKNNFHSYYYAFLYKLYLSQHKKISNTTNSSFKNQKTSL